MTEFKQYLQHELNKLNDNAVPLKIKVMDNIGAGTNWIDLPNVSTAELLTAIAGIKKGTE